MVTIINNFLMISVVMVTLIIYFFIALMAIKLFIEVTVAIIIDFFIVLLAIIIKVTKQFFIKYSKQFIKLLVITTIIIIAFLLGAEVKEASKLKYFAFILMFAEQANNSKNYNFILNGILFTLNVIYLVIIILFYVYNPYVPLFLFGNSQLGNLIDTIYNLKLAIIFSFPFIPISSHQSVK